jgi:hypothetical protein
MGLSKLGLVLVKTQSVLGTGEVSLTTSDYVKVDDGFKVAPKIDMYQPNTVRGIFGQDAAIVGKSSAEVEISMDISTGSATPPIVQFFKACNLKDTVSSNKHTFTPIHDRCATSGTSDLTIWKYDGVKCPTSYATVTKANNVSLNCSIDFKNGEPAKAKFTGMGVLPSMPTSATYPVGTLTQPTDTIYPVMSLSNVTLFGYSSPKIKEATFELGADVKLIDDLSSTYGYRYADIRGFASKLKVVMYVDPANVTNPIVQLIAGTIGTVQLTYGPAASRFTLKSSNAQIVGVDVSSSDGVDVYTLDINFVDNNFSIIVNDD